MKPQIDIRKNAFKIGAFRIEPTRNLVQKGAESYSLEPRIMEVLCELAAHHGNVVTREEFITKLWNVEFGADESLTRAISLLRKTFRKGGVTEKYIETIPKRGYRLTNNAPIVAFETDLQPNTAEIQKAVQRQEPIPSRELEQAHVVEIVPPTPAKPTPANTIKPSRRAAWTSLLIPLVTLMGAFEYMQMRTAMSNDRTTFSASPIEIDGPINEVVLGNTRVSGHSVIVMPFKNMSADPEQKYFTDGMEEELFAHLANVSELKVMGRNSTYPFRDGKTPPEGIGRALGVSHVLDGSVRIDSPQVRVSLQLISTQDNFHVWSQTYNGTLDDFIGLQDRISAQIARDLNQYFKAIKKNANAGDTGANR